MLTHENLSSNALTLIDCWRFTAADRLIHALPSFTPTGFSWRSMSRCLSGATMIFQNSFDPDAVIAAMPGATSLMGVPTFYTRLLDHPGLTRAGLRQHAPVRFRLGAAARRDARLAWRERTGHAILERYGMTETNMITSNPYDGERRPGTVGFALPGVSVRIADPDSGAPVPDGRDRRHRGQGAERVPRLLADAGEDRAGVPRRRLLHHRRSRPASIADGYIHIVGRAKDLVISGGFNVYPKEVESEIDAIDGVLESAVIGVPHPDFGEGVTAVVVPRPGAALTETAILAALGGRLAKFKAPKRIFVVELLPRNAMGKVQKAALREAYKDIYRG